MIAIAYRRQLFRSEKAAQGRLALIECGTGEVPAVEDRQIEGHVDEARRVALGDRVLQRREIGDAVVLVADDFAVEHRLFHR